jgi:hypothetical protein
VLAGVFGLAVLGWLVRGSPASGTSDAPQGEAPSRLAPAAKLKVRLAEGRGEVAALLDPAAGAWESAPATRVLLSRTPRVYQTEKPRQGQPPRLDVRCLRAGDSILFRLGWEDATRNAPEAPPRKTGQGGDPAKLYKRPTGQTSAFADAAAVMLPEGWDGGGFPSLVMGDAKGPVRLYYWNASRGPDVLRASGRARVESAGTTFRHQARFGAGGWAVTLEVPRPPGGCPVAFAVWDGEAGDRNGLKFFSVWYVLE